MERRTKIIIGVSALTVAGVAVYFLVKKRQKINRTIPDMSNTANTNQASAATVYLPEKFPLRKYMYGKKVKLLQHYLNKYYRAGIKEDGYFGDNTEAALFRALGIKAVQSSMYPNIMIKALVA